MLPAFDAEKFCCHWKGILAVEGQQSADSSRIHDRIRTTYRDGIKYVQSPFTFWRYNSHRRNSRPVELALMRTGEQKVARAYVIYRDQRADARKQAGETITQPYKSLTPMVSFNRLTCVSLKRQRKAAEGLKASMFKRSSMKPLKPLQRCKASDIATTMMMATRTRIEQEPNYTYVTARHFVMNWSQLV